MTRAELKYIISQDKLVSGIKNTFLDRLKRLFLPTYTFEYIKHLRFLRYWSQHRRGFGIIPYIYHYVKIYRMGKQLGFYIPADVFGYGLYIPHHGSVTINPNSIIGNYCQINNNVVIGQSDGKCPKIGNNVFIGSGAVICGDIRIANNVWIGANAVVTKSILEENVLVAGIPARVVGKKKKNWVETFNIT